MTAVLTVSARGATCRALYGQSTLAEPCYLPDGRLTFVAPSGAYASIPAWHSAGAWLGAAKLHPQLVEACRRHGIAVETFLALLRILAGYADAATGRDIAAAHATVGEQLGRCAKTIQRACRAAEELGLLAHVLEGADMSLEQRIVVLGHFSRGTRGARWRSLPNFYAATMPPPVAKLRLPKRAPKPVRGSSYAGSVDNRGRPAVYNQALTLGNVHLPVGNPVSLESNFSLYSLRRTFVTDCGEVTAPAGPTDDTTAAPRPTRTHQRTGAGPSPRRLDPAVETFARALSAGLLGYRDVSLHRICPALSLYVSVGLSPSDIRHGLDAYLTATGRTWLTWWRPDQQDEQARYLIGMITKARVAGYIIPGPLNGTTTVPSIR